MKNWGRINTDPNIINSLKFYIMLSMIMASQGLEKEQCDKSLNEFIAEGKNTYAILGDMKELGKFSKRYHKEIGGYCSKRNLNGVFSFGIDSIYITNEFNKNILFYIFNFLSF